MGDWWIDESKPAGPYQDNGFIEILSRFYNDSGLNGLMILGQQWGKMFASIDPAPFKGAPIYYCTVDEINTERQKESDSFAKADTLLKVPSGTTEKLAKQFGEISEREQKRQIGRGNISGHGPRSGTTFGRGGKRRY